jgi:hypothetical protein
MAEHIELVEQIQQLRAEARIQEEAQRIAWGMAVRLVEKVRAHIELRNYGLADMEAEELLKQLPHDHGAQTFFPLMDEVLATVRQRRTSIG